MKVVSIVVAPGNSSPSPLASRGRRWSPNTTWRSPVATRHRSARTVPRSSFVTRMTRAMARDATGRGDAPARTSDRGALPAPGTADGVAFPGAWSRCHKEVSSWLLIQETPVRSDRGHSGCGGVPYLMSWTPTWAVPGFGGGAALTSPEPDRIVNLPARHDVAPFPVSHIGLSVPLVNAPCTSAGPWFWQSASFVTPAGPQKVNVAI